jgi:choline dehydrogenase-like flavoprotein
VLQYLLYGTGAIGSNVCEGGAFVSTSGDRDWPDIQMHFLPAYVIDHGRIRVKGHGMTLNTALLRPRSRGEVRLQSADPLADPLIDPNYLAEPGDLADGIEGFKIARQILAAPSLRKLSDGEHLPGKEVLTDRQIADYVRQWGKTDFHPVGTCKMGSEHDGVVDQDLRVYGVAGLRVIDNSIMPTLISGNTNAPAIMIGERGADAILGRRLPPADTLS